MPGPQINETVADGPDIFWPAPAGSMRAHGVGQGADATMLLRAEMVAIGISSAVVLAARLAAAQKGDAGLCWEEAHGHLHAAHAAAQRAVHAAVCEPPWLDTTAPDMDAEADEMARGVS